MNLLALPSTVRKGDTPHSIAAGGGNPHSIAASGGNPHSIAASGDRGSLPQPQ